MKEIFAPVHEKCSTASMKHRIVEIRREKGLSQADLAERVGATQSMVGKLERGERKMTFGWLGRFGEALGVPASDLVDVSDAPVQVGDVDASGRVIDVVVNPSLVAFEDDDPEARMEIMASGQMGDRCSVGVLQDVTIRVPAHSMFIFDGKQRRPSKEVHGRLVAAWIVEGPEDEVQAYQIFIGQIMPGSEPRRHHLLPLSGSLIENALVAWVSPIEQIGLP